MKSKRFVKKKHYRNKKKNYEDFPLFTCKRKRNAREEVSFPVEYTFFYKKMIFLPEPRFS